MYKMQCTPGAQLHLTFQAKLLTILFSPRYLSEHRNLSENFSFWLSRASKHSSASSYVRSQARLRPDFRALPDPQMPGHSRLSSDANEIFEHS
jgi:hypothetical protein